MGDHLVQVLFEHHAFAEHRLGLGLGKQLIELVEAFDHFLTTSGTGMNRFQADRPGVQQMLRRRARILQGKHAETVEHHAAHPLGKQRSPASRRMGMVVEQSVTDGFGADEVVVDITAPQILRPLDPQLPGSRSAHKGLGRQQVQVSPCMQLRVVAAAVLEPQYLRQPAGQCAVGFNFVHWRVGEHRMGDHQFPAVCRGHASPFNRRLMNVVEGVQGSGQGPLRKEGF
ncbi:hypothetical protein D9M73_158370 [compost metagenome]